MKMIVGLGNPGEKYKNTRHNLGFMVLDEWARKTLPLPETKWKKNQKFKAEFISRTPEFILVKPQTMMNASGYAVFRLASFYKLKPEDIWVVHDDVDLPSGKIKVRAGGAAAGHHGVESIIKQLGTDEFIRFRLGIGHPGRGADRLVERFVLENFSPQEKSEVKRMIKKTIQALEVALEKGLLKAMSQFNQ